ncbi:MAG: hypothetical protein KA300_01205 [Bacteroidales bacterium]|nr:hypothetical protein [Bacteroidales bacterium]
MQSKYPIFELREIKRIVFFSLIITLCLACIAVSFDLRLFNLIAFLGPAFIIVQKIRTKYLINSEKMTFSIMFGKKEWRKVNLNEISKMEIHRRKNGKIKKINLRNSSNLFFTAEPARGDEFAAQIKKLLPGINTEERKAKWYS